MNNAPKTADLWRMSRMPIDTDWRCEKFKGFKVQRVGVTAVRTISDLPASEIVNYFREHPETAKALISESYDKRFTPSTFFVEEGSGLFRVGWFARDASYECVKEFSDLADAATDYLLFSLGKSRWSPTIASDNGTSPA